MGKALLLTGIVLASALSAGAQSVTKRDLLQNIVHLSFPKTFGSYGGSAFLLDNGILVTYAHNMYRSPNRYVKWLTLYVREAVPSATPESLTLSADYIERNTVTSSLFIYPQVIRHKKARIKYDYAFIRISETDMQRLRPELLPATIATTPPVLTDSLYLIGYPDSKLTSLSYAPGRWAVAPEENDATLTDLTRMWYVTDALTDGASGSPLLQIRDGKAVLVGVHTDGAADPPYEPGNKTAGVTNWTKFNEAYQAALQKPGR